MGVLCLVYLICALRTNIIFVGIFFTLVIGFGFLAGAFWQVANGNLELAGKLQVAGGAVSFVTCMLGWWIFTAIMLAALDFPFQLPGEFSAASSLSFSACSFSSELWTNSRPVVGDLSGWIKGASEKKKSHEEEADLTT